MSDLAELRSTTSTSSSLEKAAPRGERARIEALIAREEARVRRSFRRFLDDMRSPEVRRQVRIALERDGIEDAMRVIDAHVARMGSALSQSFQAAGYAEAEALARYFGGSRVAVAISFDPSYPRAAELMRRNRLGLVREFTRLQRDATRSALIEALRAGSGPVQTARAFRDSIGLTNYQLGVVANYRRQLEAGDARALTRDLRDRRFDPTVRRAAQEGEALGPRRINRMVEQYRNRYLQLRAETIARTETLQTVNIARDEALIQMTEQLDLPKEAVTRTWRATQDARTRDTHAEMDGQERGIDEPFDSPSGAQMMYPGDTELGAGPEEIINCRCVLITSVASPE